MDGCVKGKLLFMCGKMAAGKSTLSRSLAATQPSLLLVQDHELHSIVASDEFCKRQLKQRSQHLNLALGAKWTTNCDFAEVTSYFEPPAADERLNVIRHERA
jgi:hypothetical protein